MALLTEDIRTMAGAGWRLKCSEFDGDEELDSLPSAGLTCAAWKSHPAPYY
jgi:hypothetical protein